MIDYGCFYHVGIDMRQADYGYNNYRAQLLTINRALRTDNKSRFVTSIKYFDNLLATLSFINNVINL